MNKLLPLVRVVLWTSLCCSAPCLGAHRPNLGFAPGVIEMEMIVEWDYDTSKNHRDIKAIYIPSKFPEMDYGLRFIRN